VIKNFGSMWKKTHDAQGMSPKFDMKCPMCRNKMVLRNSLLEHETKGGSNFDTTLLYNHAKYKCIRCGFIAPFDVVFENDYWVEVLTARDNQRLYVPPLEEWASEDEQVAEQLKNMGYFD